MTRSIVFVSLCLLKGKRSRVASTLTAGHGDLQELSGRAYSQVGRLSLPGRCGFPLGNQLKVEKSMVKKQHGEE